MKGILVNENLPAGLAAQLIRHGLAAIHVTEIGLGGAKDSQIWTKALDLDFAVMTKDSDYLDLVAVSPFGKVILIGTGNLRIQQFYPFLDSKVAELNDFLQSTDRVTILRT